MDIGKSRWEKVYWFARMLIKSDQYGGVGSNSALMNKLASAIKAILENESLEKEAYEIKEKILKNAVRNTLLENKKEGSNIYAAILNFCDDIESQISSIDDYRVLAFACEKILVPINESLKQIPNNDSVF